ncbi:hypothetical protein DFH06DRAFT_1173106 [Mycena polygramma]|nr:hypothetical protein DFH06DRAFT_1173106 [Mycena polygramma]
MHRAWQIVEVVGMICEQVACDGPSELCAGVPTESYPDRRGDLSRLARTCTIFLEPALNALWAYQATILHLLRTMPDDIWDITEIRDADDADDEDGILRLKIVLRRVVTTADWTRFIFYAHRVKSFKDSHVHRATAEVYETLSSSFPGNFIFPNMRTLEWEPKQRGVFHYIRLFLSPGLTRLDLTLDRIPDALIFDTLTDKIPRLKSLKISGSAGNAARAALSRFICSLRDLETLTVGDLDPAAFSHVAASPLLRYLSLKSTEPLPSLPPPARFPHFSALTELESGSIEHAPILFEQAKPSRLVDFTLTAKSWPATPTKRTIHQLYSALATNCNNSSLRTIFVRKQDTPDFIAPDQLYLYLVSGEELKPLFRFQNLTVVSLAHTAGVDLDDDVVLAMARAWPCVERLRLPCNINYRITPRVTLEGLYAFAQHCPHLDELQILFDATTIPALRLRSKTGVRKRVSQARLELLDITYSPIDITKPHHVAKFLGTVFPCLEMLQTTYYEHPQWTTDVQLVPSHKAWMRVSAELDCFSS